MRAARGNRSIWENVISRDEESAAPLPHADQIRVLEHGRIVESGSHATLLAQRGRYARLYEMHAAPYR